MMPKTRHTFRNFDPHRIGSYEKENYVAYYQKNWLKLLRVSVGLVKESFGLSWVQAIYAAYLVARAEIAFAPFPKNDMPKAESYLRRFYQFIKNILTRNSRSYAPPNWKSTGGSSIASYSATPRTRNW